MNLPLDASSGLLTALIHQCQEIMSKPKPIVGSQRKTQNNSNMENLSKRSYLFSCNIICSQH